jgi:hypothetical protein
VSADVKDRALDPGFIERITPSRLRQALDSIATMIDRRPEIVGLLLSGDLTDRGDMDGYQDCIGYLERALSRTRLWNENSLFVTPGNHDVDRNAADPAGRSAKLHAAWDKLGLDVLATSGVRQHEIERDGNRAVVFSLSSCAGCGEERRLPEEISAELASLLKDYVVRKGGLKGAFDIVGEKLDTPAFEAKDLESLTAHILALDHNVAPIVLAHHGILPQGLLRVDLYTEVINGGVARWRFRDLDHPVLYCHGHIHENPIEVLVDPDRERRPVVLISAPLLRDGFNFVSVAFGRDGTLLGVLIEQHLIQSYGGIKLEKQLRIPLVETGSGAVSTDELGEEVGKRCPMAGIRFTTLVSEMKSAFSCEESDIRDRVEELEWLGTLRISAREEPVHRWHVRRIRP